MAEENDISLPPKFGGKRQMTEINLVENGKKYLKNLVENGKITIFAYVNH
ncbi:MAG: hypothetical protein ACI3Y0_11585 [Prevotella sp.]